MKILFVGDGSTAHYHLAEGLRLLGHNAKVVSNSATWRQFPGQITIERGKGLWGALIYLFKWIILMPSLRDYDILVFNGLYFMSFKPWIKNIFYNFLRKRNGKIIYSALGTDYYYVKCFYEERMLEYNDYHINGIIRKDSCAVAEVGDWYRKDVIRLNKKMIEDSCLITAPVFDTWFSLHYYFPNKTFFLPLCIESKEFLDNIDSAFQAGKGSNKLSSGKVRIFFGIQRDREKFKGHDVIEKALDRLTKDYPDRLIVRKVENVPYKEYLEIMRGSDILLDQLYQYGYGMNGVIAMSKGIICAGGGEEEMYEEMFHEHSLRPVINLPCDENGVYKTLEHYVLHPELIPELKRQSLEMAHKYHDNRKVARQFVELVKSLDK